MKYRMKMTFSVARSLAPSEQEHGQGGKEQDRMERRGSEGQLVATPLTLSTDIRIQNEGDRTRTDLNVLDMQIGRSIIDVGGRAREATLIRRGRQFIRPESTRPKSSPCRWPD